MILTIAFPLVDVHMRLKKMARFLEKSFGIRKFSTVFHISAAKNSDDLF